MPETQYSLSWNSYRNKICEGISGFQQNGEFVDMTLAADGHHVQVHKMVMSLASPYIMDLIATVKCSHPVIFLNNVSYTTLCSILQYVYTGEVVVVQEYMKDFLEACEALCIQGLDKMMEFLQETNELKLDGEQPETNLLIKRDQKMCANQIQMDEDFDDDRGEVSYLYESDDMPSDEQKDPIEISGKSETINMDQKSLIENNSLKFTLSNHGNLQIVLNRYIYNLKYTSKTMRRMWRCVQHQRKPSCRASVITQGNRVLKRTYSHNHKFHDERILKKYSSGTIFSATDDAEKKLFSVKKQKEVEKKSSRNTTDNNNTNSGTKILK